MNNQNSINPFMDVQKKNRRKSNLYFLMGITMMALNVLLIVVMTKS